MNNYLVPNYNLYIEPRLFQLSDLCNEHVKPHIDTISARTVELYKVHLEPQINLAIKKSRPAVAQAAAELEKLFVTVRTKAGEFTEGWGDKVDEGIKIMRVKIDEFGVIARNGIDSSINGVQKWYQNTNAKEVMLKSYQSAKDTAGDYAEIAKAKSADYIEIGKAKTIEFYDFVMVASGIFFSLKLSYDTNIQIFLYKNV